MRLLSTNRARQYKPAAPASEFLSRGDSLAGAAGSYCGRPPQKGEASAVLALAAEAV